MSKKASEVGGRSRAEIIADPLATADEIQPLAEQDPIAALHHPNCPVELWWQLAVKHPMEAESSITYELMTLENPGRWPEMEQRRRVGWLEDGCQRLSKRECMLFAADCAERVLPLFEKMIKGDKGPRSAIEKARSEARSLDPLLPQSYRDRMRRAHTSAYHAVEYRLSVSGAHWAAAAAYEAANANDVSVLTPVIHLAIKLGEGVTRDRAAATEETHWQWTRIKQYLRGTANSLIDTLGARSFPAIKADPQATPEEIRHLSEKNGLAALQHPNCPQDLWWDLAILFPIEAPKSPAGQLFTLEDPTRWVDLEQRWVSDWIFAILQKLKPKGQRLFAADCAERVLPCWEEEHPNDDRPRKSIEAARLAAHGQLRKKALEPVHIRAMAASQSSSYGNDAWLAASAASHVSHADAEWGAYNAHKESARAAGIHATRLATGGDAKDPAAYRAELMWQWQRLQAYLRGETLSGIGKTRHHSR